MPASMRFDWLCRPHIAEEGLRFSARARFAKALAELPAIERSAIALSGIGGLDEAEIAQRLGTDPAMVRKLLSRAHTSIRVSIALQARRGLAVDLFDVRERLERMN
jgi:DNA-directed RNA polymerase specialized sigma24 family protein